MHCQK